MRSVKCERDMHNPGLMPGSKPQATFLEYLQHRDVVRQDLGDQFFKSGCTGNLSEVMHQNRTESLSLVLIEHGECDFGLARLNDDISPAADNHGLAVFFHNRDQSHLLDEVDVHEEVDFLL